jgi:hypothetical protein
VTIIRAVGPIVAVLLLCLRAPGQQLGPEVLAVAHASQLVRETVDAHSNCACLESMTRTRTDRNRKVKQNQRDTVEIEVTTIGDREWFSWPGREDGFVSDPTTLVSFGLMNTGQLTSDLKAVFLNGFAGRRFHGAGTFGRHCSSITRGHRFLRISNLTTYLSGGKRDSRPERVVLDRSPDIGAFGAFSGSHGDPDGF